MTKQTQAQLKAKEKYNKANTITYCLRLNKNTDKDIIELLNSVGSKTGYIYVNGHIESRYVII